MLPVHCDRERRQARRPLCCPLGREEPATTTPACTSGRPLTRKTEVQDKLTEAKLIPRTKHVAAGDRRSHAALRRLGAAPGSLHHGSGVSRPVRGNFRAEPRRTGRRVACRRGGQRRQSKPRSTRERARAAVAERGEEAQDQARGPRCPAGSGHGELSAGRESESTGRFSGRDPAKRPDRPSSAKQHRVIALARLGKKQDALTELAKFQKGDASESSKLYLAAVVAAELGEGIDKALETIEARSKNSPRMPSCGTTPPVPSPLPRRCHGAVGQGEKPETG